MTPFILAIALIAADQATDPRLTSLVSRAASFKSAEIAKTEADIKKLTTSRENIPGRAEKLKNAKAYIAELRKSKPKIPPVQQPFVVGDVGAWTHGTVRVKQVLDKSTARVVVEHLERAPVSGPLFKGTAEAALANEAMVSKEYEFAFKGDTSGMVDGQPFSMPAVVEVSGTYQYTTVTGAPRTLFSVTAFDASGFESAAASAK